MHSMVRYHYFVLEMLKYWFCMSNVYILLHIESSSNFKFYLLVTYVHLWHALPRIEMTTHPFTSWKPSCIFTQLATFISIYRQVLKWDHLLAYVPQYGDMACKLKTPSSTDNILVLASQLSSEIHCFRYSPATGEMPLRIKGSPWRASKARWDLVFINIQLLHLV